MTCERWRDALSAWKDGEDPGVPAGALDEHLRDCVRCRLFAARLERLQPQMTAAHDPAPDRSIAILAAMRDDQRARQPALRRVSRRALALVAIVQLAVTLPDLWSAPGAHTVRDLGAFQIALAVGFLVAAVRPTTAAGLLPTAGALALALMVVVGIDVGRGRAAAGAEMVHVTELVGVSLLWLITQRDRAASPPQPA